MNRQDFYTEIMSQVASLEAKYGFYAEFANRANWYILVNEHDWVGVRKNFFVIENSFTLDDDNEFKFMGIKVMRTINKIKPTLVVELNKINRD